jgi:hypothetical protein
MKKIVAICISAFVLCLSGCFGVPTAGTHPYNGSDEGALQIRATYPNQGPYDYPDAGQYQNQQHREHNRL